MTHKRITIRDLAKVVGVNPSTVSRALNPSTKHLITAEVVEKITRAADDMGYFPNRMAAALVQKRSFTIGMLVPDVTNPVFPPIIRGIEDALEKTGYTLITVNSDNMEEYEKTAFRRLREHAIDGCIMATAHREDEVVDDCLKQKIPLVLVNRTTDRQDVNAVINDDEAGIADALDHLIGLGHKKIAHIAGPQNTSTGYVRLKKFKSFLKSKKLPNDMVLVAGGFSEKAGYNAMRKLLNKTRDLTAVMAGNDLMALGCIDAIQEAGLECPGDISLIGYNDMPLMDRITPSLTTVSIAQYQIGQRAAEILLNQLQGAEGEIVFARLKPKLIIRGSTRQIN